MVYKTTIELDEIPAGTAGGDERRRAVRGGAVGRPPSTAPSSSQWSGANRLGVSVPPCGQNFSTNERSRFFQAPLVFFQDEAWLGRLGANPVDILAIVPPLDPARRQLTLSRYQARVIRANNSR